MPGRRGQCVREYVRDRGKSFYVNALRKCCMQCWNDLDADVDMSVTEAAKRTGIIFNSSVCSAVSRSRYTCLD